MLLVEEKLKDHPKELEAIKAIVKGDVKRDLTVEKADEPKIVENLKRLYIERNPPICPFDFYLVVDGKKLGVHKCIIGNISEYFKKPFELNTTEVQKGEMHIPGAKESNGLTYTALDSLLLYFYSSDLTHINDPFDCVYILGSADYLTLSRNFTTSHSKLINHCQRKTSEGLKTENSIGLFKLIAEKIPDVEDNTKKVLEDMHNKVTEFIVANLEAVKATPEFKDLDQFYKDQLLNIKA